MPNSSGLILIVEDDANLLAGIRDILELEGYAVLTASNGVDGLAVLHKADTLPDLIVSDIMMPKMDGIAFLEEVREIEQFISIPFIYLTAKGEKTDIHRGKQLGVDDYVVKPFNANDLLVAIRSRLKRARAIEKVQQGKQDQLKQTILTILNHEFRTPLTFVVAYADMLSDIPNADATGAATDDAEMLTFLEGVRTGADRLRRLVENFILVVEIQTGSARKTFEWRKRAITDLNSLLWRAAQQANTIPDTPHTYEIECDPNIPDFVGDEEYIHTAIVHLLDNAFKFSEPDQPVLLRAMVDDDRLLIEVEDRGRGIPPDEIDQIWTTFYQINRPQYEDQGAGSGLAIVRGLVDLHGGRVDVESQPGVGSTFRLYIPLA